MPGQQETNGQSTDYQAVLEKYLKAFQSLQSDDELHVNAGLTFTLLEKYTAPNNINECLKRDNTIEDILDAMNTFLNRKVFESNSRLNKFGLIGGLGQKLSPERWSIVLTLSNMFIKLDDERLDAYSAALYDYRKNIKQAYRENNVKQAKIVSQTLENALQNEPGLWGQVKHAVNLIVREISRALGTSKKGEDAYEGRWWTSHATKTLRASKEYTKLKAEIDALKQSGESATSTSPTPGTDSG